MKKMISLLMVFFLKKNKDKLKSFKLLNQIKKFILIQICETEELKLLSNFLCSLQMLSVDVQFNEKELIKFRIIEKLIELLDPNI